MQLFYILRVCALVQLADLFLLRMSFVAEAVTSPFYTLENLRKCTRQENSHRTSTEWLKVGEVLSTEDDPIKQWSITEVLEHGGMGYAFKAQDKREGQGGKEVVIKVAKEEKERLPMIEEANMLDRVKDVSQVPKLETLCRADDKNVVLVIEYGGPDLSSVVEQLKRPLTWSETVCVGMQGLAVLQELKKLDVIHRDIKPANLLWAQKKSEEDFCKGALRIIDFGLARSDKHKGRPTTVDGTPAYMSWRAEARHRPSERDDLFSMALTLLKVYGIYTDNKRSDRCGKKESWKLKEWDLAFVNELRQDKTIDPLLTELYDLGVAKEKDAIDYGELKQKWEAQANTPSPPSRSTSEDNLRGAEHSVGSIQP